MKIEAIKKELNKINTAPNKNNSAWKRGVAVYTEELIENLEGFASEPQTMEELKSMMLNGADNWVDYSWGGSSLIYNEEIAERLCTPSELKRYNGGRWSPKYTEWLDIQARALAQADRRIREAFRQAQGY